MWEHFVHSFMVEGAVTIVFGTLGAVTHFTVRRVRKAHSEKCVLCKRPFTAHTNVVRFTGFGPADDRRGGANG